mmetsp:Transcript_16890/g.40035  ORF Transcript_16890/g.40035 Transcript_16890/m.40035 type:complete len:327 (+) Transcript_16890:274-1254(+)
MSGRPGHSGVPGLHVLRDSRLRDGHAAPKAGNFSAEQQANRAGSAPRRLRRDVLARGQSAAAGRHLNLRRVALQPRPIQQRQRHRRILGPARARGHLRPAAQRRQPDGPVRCRHADSLPVEPRRSQLHCRRDAQMLSADPSLVDHKQNRTRRRGFHGSRPSDPSRQARRERFHARRRHGHAPRPQARLGLLFIRSTPGRLRCQSLPPRSSVHVPRIAQGPYLHHDHRPQGPDQGQLQPPHAERILHRQSAGLCPERSSPSQRLHRSHFDREVGRRRPPEQRRRQPRPRGPPHKIPRRSPPELQGVDTQHHRNVRLGRHRGILLPVS